MPEYQRDTDKLFVDFKAEEVISKAKGPSDECPGDIASDIFGFVDVQSFGFAHWLWVWFFNKWGFFFGFFSDTWPFAVFGCHHWVRRSNWKEKQVCASSWRAFVIAWGSLKSQASSA